MLNRQLTKPYSNNSQIYKFLWSGLAKLKAPAKSEVETKPLDQLSVSELVKHNDKGIEDLVAFLDFSADEVSEEEKKRIKEEKERKRKERERKRSQE